MMSRPDTASRSEHDPPPTIQTAIEVRFGAADQLAGELVEKMNCAWKEGRFVQAEELLALHPHLMLERDAVLRLVCEEFCLRREHNRQLDLPVWLERFPTWRGEIEALLRCQQLIEPEIQSADGKLFGRLHDFQLLADLGHGGQGKVFLATQPLLADRPVVVKVTPCRGREHLSLARLQHTHIVPLFWAQDYEDEDQRILCMPYFGNVTVQMLLTMLQKTPLGERTGQHILDVIDRAQPSVLPAQTPRTPARQLLARATYAQAIAWMGACLAEALQYAHERDVLHLDIKPSNVLWTTDGQPMLLDFHLSRPPIPAKTVRPPGLGGTPLYMAPEQEAALNACQRREPVPDAVDGRADLFGLGLLLHQALGGPFPFPLDAPLRLDEINPQVSPGLANIVLKCLSRWPDLRYPNADSLARDLRRYLSDEPLRHVSDGGPRERWRKWRRRKPHALVYMALVGMMALLVGGVFGWWRVQHARQLEQEATRARHDAGRIAQAERLLDQAQGNLREGRFDLALVAVQSGVAILPDTPDAERVRESLAAQQRLARTRQSLAALHAGVNELRSAVVVEVLSPAQLDLLVARCHDLWAKRQQLPDVADEAARQDLTDLAVIWSELRLRRAAPEDVVHQRRAILTVLDDVAAAHGVSPLLDELRRAHLHALDGKPPEAGTLGRQERPWSAWEHAARARSHLQQASHPIAVVGWLACHVRPAGPASISAWPSCPNLLLAQAAWHSEQALALEPDHYWAYFYQGVAAYRRKLPHEAMNAFRVCIALKPLEAVAHYNRGLAAFQLGDLAQAHADYTKALELDKTFGNPALNRALVRVKLRDFDAAVADLHLAQQRGVDPELIRRNLGAVESLRKSAKPKNERP